MFPPFWLALVLLPQQKDAPPESKQVMAVVGQIRRLAASEPVVFGIDTRLRTAQLLIGKYPKIAKELLREAESASGGVTSAEEQDQMRVRMVELLAPLDLEEAEGLIGSIRRDRKEDYVAQAYDKLVAFVASSHGNGRDMISKGLTAGGFRSQSAAEQLEKRPSTALFAEILSAFPPTPNERDIEYLLDRTKQIAGLNRTLAIEAMDKALKAAQSKEELREIAAILGSIDPELLKRYQTEHDDLAAAMSAKDPSPRAEEKQELNTPDLTNLSYLDALTEARKLTNPAERAGLLIELYRRDGITQQQRAMVASEALAAVSAMPLSNDKLIGMAMISRDHARNGDPANAAFAAELLAETYAKACDCGNGRCRHSDETFDCLSMVNDFALYLDEFKITPESLALNNISLEVRLLMLKLYPLLNLKPPSLWSLGN